MRGTLGLADLVNLLLKKLWFILLFAVAGLLFAFGYTKVLMTPQYASSITMYVSNTQSMEQQDRINYNDITASQRLVGSYTAILQSNSVLNEVIATENLQYTANRLRTMLSVRAVNQTELMEVLITSSDPQASADIANAIARVAPEKIQEFLPAYIKLVDEAVPNPVPTSPHVPRNLILGFLGGFVLALLLVILQEMMDMRIRDEEDLQKNYDIPILGSIPAIHSRSKGGYGYHE